MSSLEVIRSNKGHHKVIHLGFMYTKHKAMGDKIRWRCVQRANHCKGSIFTSSEFSEPRVTVNHNHMPDLDAVEFARSRTIFAERMSWIPALDFGDSEPEMDNSYVKPEFYDDESSRIDNRQSSSSSIFLQAISEPSSRTKSRSVPHPTKPPPPPAPKLPPPQHSAGRPSHPPSLAVRNSGMKPLAPKPRPPSPQPPPPPPEVCLRWNSYHSNMQATFPSLLNNQQFVDVTLACEGRSLKCHKVMLSACSTYFNELLSQNPCQHPIILMRDLKFWEVQSLVEFMYRGEVNVSQDKLPSLLSAAEALQIKGLASSPSPMMDDDMMSNSLPMMPDDYLEKETPSPASSRRIRRRRTIASAPPQPMKPTLLPNNQRSPRLQRVTPSTSGTHYHPDPHPQEPPTRKRRIDPSPIKSPSPYMSIKQEPLDINDHSNESEDLPTNHFVMQPRENDHSETKMETTEANSVKKKDKTEETTNNQNNSEEPATSDDEAHDNDHTDHDKEQNDNPATDYDLRSDSPDDILQPEVTMNSDSVTGDD